MKYFAIVISYTGRNDVLRNPDISAVKDIPLKYWIHVGDRIEAMTQAQQDIYEANVAQAVKAAAEARIDKLEEITPIHLAKALVSLGIVSGFDLKQAIKDQL